MKYVILGVYCFDRSGQHRRRLPEVTKVMAAWVTPCHGLLCQLNTEILKIKSMLNPVSPRPSANYTALIAWKNSAVCKSETDTSGYTYRVRFIVHCAVVPGQAVVNGISKRTGKECIHIPVDFQGRRRVNYTTRMNLSS